MNQLLVDSPIVNLYVVLVCIYISAYIHHTIYNQLGI